jgi:transcriptional regulator with XRE-family HTH domain
MCAIVAYETTTVKHFVESHHNDGTLGNRLELHIMKQVQPMNAVIRIHKSKSPPRVHYIQEWIEKRGMRQADVVRALGVDKATVSRWCSGYMPENKNLGPLIEFLQLEAPSDLFRHPDDTWMRRFFEGRTREEMEHIKRSLEVTFPKGNGTDG